MIGSGDHAYALPFYRVSRSLLIDHIVMPPDIPISDEIPSITRSGNTFIGDLENVTSREKPMVVLGGGDRHLQYTGKCRCRYLVDPGQ
ncbi:MAG: hypothetical protein WCF90_08995 [Methanomicrobiales archaeon]